MAIINKAAVKIKSFGVKIVNENKSPKNTTSNVNIVIKNTNKHLRIALNGTLILYKSIKPVSPVKRTHKVDTSSSVSLIMVGRNTIIKTLATIVKAVGIDLFKTLIIILPLILSLLGSKAKINDGIPIVTTLVKVSCIGSKG